MGYYDYLCGLLSPLGVYDLSSGAGARELESIGCQMDKVFDSLEEFGGELMPLTAAGYGLANYEALFPYRPSYITLADRRQAVMALLRIRNGYFTQEALCDTIKGCGINAVVSESGTPMTVAVTFPDNWGVPDDFEKIKYRIEQILPCHLGIVYDFLYSNWRLLMAGIGSWRALHERCGSWRLLEIFR